ncbi:hypothetical protein [Inhella proteolytica]|uniref:hypothetical protein n=1 Tax=Inhella proteolytica TaxID=2795029 RepID=UPI001E59387A|nr:hypothetical protein [Inhella proteolytica]
MSAHWFLLGSAAMGLGQVLDAGLLWRARGRISLTPLCFSLAEWIWAALALLAWREADPAVPWWLPALFLAYVAGFAVHAARQARPEEPALRDLTPREIQAGALFGALYLGLSVMLLLAGPAAEISP